MKEELSSSRELVSKSSCGFSFGLESDLSSGKRPACPAVPRASSSRSATAWSSILWTFDYLLSVLFNLLLEHPTFQSATVMSSPSSTNGYFEYDNLQLRHNFSSCYVQIGYVFTFRLRRRYKPCSTYVNSTGNDLGRLLDY